jgi:hypothetical protein
VEHLAQVLWSLPYIYFAQRKKNIYAGVGVHVIANVPNALSIAAVILG